MKKKKDKPRALIPREMNIITNEITKKRLTGKDFKGIKEVNNLKMLGQPAPVDLNLVATWESGGVEYFVKQADIEKLSHPKVYVSQDKNIKLLIALVRTQQRKKPDEEKRAEATFTLKEYARLRGYTDEEIKKGGKFFEELKRDLFTGACTTYRINEIEINGEKYVAYGIPNFYRLYKPKRPKGKWIVVFNSPYGESILRKTGQFYNHYLEEIADRTTTQKPYLHLFYNQLVFRKRNSGITMRVPVINFLKKMGVEEQSLKRPKRCFNILKECISYTAKKYPDMLKKVDFYQDYYEDWPCLPLKGRNLENFDRWEYESFKENLKATIAVDDVRKSYIQFIGEKIDKKIR